VGDPTGGNAEEAPIPPRGKQVPGAEINGLVLFMINYKINFIIIKINIFYKINKLF
jgi:hypothetical protein